MGRDVLDNGRWRLHAPGHLYHHMGLLFTRPTARTAGPVAQKEAQFLFLFLSFHIPCKIAQ